MGRLRYEAEEEARTIFTEPCGKIADSLRLRVDRPVFLDVGGFRETVEGRRDRDNIRVLDIFQILVDEERSVRTVESQDHIFLSEDVEDALLDLGE